MPVKVTLITDNRPDWLSDEEPTDQEFVIKDRKDYAKIGFAAARWARQALRDAKLGEGGDHHELRMDIDFLGDEEPEPAAKPAKKRRGKKAKADGAES
jgi:hypothetical protein